MSGSVRDAALVAATITMGLNAGLFYTFSMCVMPGLRNVDDRAFVHVMQRINVAILNGWFALVFAGPGILTVLAAALRVGADQPAPLPWTVAGLVLYVVMLVVTMRVNVPLNNELSAAGDPDQNTDLGPARERFEAKWVRWNLVRATVSTGGFGSLAWALVLTG